jgi:hypothetical protein
MIDNIDRQPFQLLRRDVPQNISPIIVAQPIGEALALESLVPSDLRQVRGPVTFARSIYSFPILRNHFPFINDKLALKKGPRYPGRSIVKLFGTGS